MRIDRLSSLGSETAMERHGEQGDHYLNTTVLASGQNLSNGQRQLVAMARAQC